MQEKMSNLKKNFFKKLIFGGFSWLCGEVLEVVVCAADESFGCKYLAGLTQQRLACRSQSGSSASLHLHPKTINTKWSLDRQEHGSPPHRLTDEWPEPELTICLDAWEVKYIQVSNVRERCKRRRKRKNVIEKKTKREVINVYRSKQWLISALLQSDYFFSSETCHPWW